MSDTPSNSEKPPEPPVASRKAFASSEKLVPIRIDVTSDDNNIRVFDTLLWDPSCWIVPLYHPLEESVERNVQELAHSVLSDAEVYGMGRTSRHFTGRLDVWSRGLQARVAHQIRPQLWACLLNAPPSCEKQLLMIQLNLSIHGVLVQDEVEWDVANRYNPPVLEFAKQLSNDLNLPEEATNAIALVMLEQIHGIHVPDTPQTRPSALAKTLDTKLSVMDLAHLVALHRPANLDSRLH